MEIEIPAYLATSIIATSLAFLVSVWIMMYVASKGLAKRLVFSLVTAIVLLSWLGVVVILGRTRFFAINPLVAPNIVFAFLLLFGLLRNVYFSSAVRSIIDRIPAHWMIASQIYRVVGISFIPLYYQGLLPAAFAFPSGYGDIVVGITAPFVAYMYAKKKPYSRELALIWNMIGIADLVIAIGIGNLGYPRPLQMLPLHPSTELLSLFPLVLIPLFAVPLALVLHFFSFRMLIKKID